MDLKGLKKEIEKNQRKIELLDNSVNTGKSTPAERRVWVGCKCYIQGVKQTVEAVDKSEFIFMYLNPKADEDKKLWKEIKHSLQN